MLGELFCPNRPLHRYDARSVVSLLLLVEIARYRTIQGPGGTLSHDPGKKEPTMRQVSVPHLIRLKPRALARLPIYLDREGWAKPALLISEGLPTQIVDQIVGRIPSLCLLSVPGNTLEWVQQIEREIDQSTDVVIGLGGGKALDSAKLLAYRLNLPYLALPTSLSNDGFCSPNSSLTVAGRRRSYRARLPAGVVIDTEVVMGAPKALWLSGIGDLVAKRTATFDWKRAFHTDGTPFDDLAALLSDSSVYQFLAYPIRDLEGTKLLAQALLFNGVAMEMAGCSRPASGSEHLISHALDQISEKPRLHGLQVGLATYWMMLVQGQDNSELDKLFQSTGFWEHWQKAPGSRSNWEQALDKANSIKQDYVTVLSNPDDLEIARMHLHTDSRLTECLI